MKKILLILALISMVCLVGCSENTSGTSENKKSEVEKESGKESSKNNKREKAIADAESKAKQQLYLEARNILKRYLASHKDDSGVEALFLNYQEEYVNQQIEEAEAVFTDYTKYDAAIQVIRVALQNCPDNEDLLSQKAYYEEYEPVKLYSLEPYKDSHGFIQVSGASDGFGNNYNDCIIKAEYNSSAYGIYDINYKYNKFTATVFSMSEHSAKSFGTITIYGDGNIIYQKDNIDVYGRPFDIAVDITGVRDLKIEIVSNSYAEIFGLANAVLQKTAK